MPRARATRPAGTTEAKPAEAAVPEVPAAPAAVEAVTAAVPEGTDVSVVSAEPFDPELVAAAVTAAVDPADSDVNPDLPDVPEPTRAGTVEVRVLHVAFPFLDKDGNYQVLKQGETGKVTAAQADRGVTLGAVERV